ncbi:19075_t:CDS:1 [Cetraspora pellucida]|uniref:19075_t:CDS:1 n=1 Tax=Cetraspora pellucida TaxID=1433469 RepID=A0A9N9J936_9GLOM|nr:19075_t:CDS:1 [Cetraspora pellucida]
MNSIVTLNVGGVHYVTTKDTLLKHKGFFSGLFSDNFSITLDCNNNTFVDRNGELFKYVLEFLRNNALPKRSLSNKALLEELLQEAEFYCIEDLITEINSILNTVQNNEQGDVKIRIGELGDYLKKGFHVIGKGMELIRYHICPHRHDPPRIGINEYFDSECRHSHVKLVEDCVPFLVVSTSLPVGPIFDLSSGIKMEEQKVISCL